MQLRPTDVLGAFFLCGIAFLLAAAAVALTLPVIDWPGGRWLALHLAFVGGVSQLVLGASQFFTGAFLATDPPPRILVRGQLIVWNLGTILLVTAVPRHAVAATWLATALLLTGLGLWTAAILSLRRRSLSRLPWATRWYLAAAAFLAVGIPAGALIANGVSWPHGSLYAAHPALNLGGWFGAAIVGTLHTFYPSLTHTRLRWPRLQAVAFAAWTGGVAALAVGYAAAIDPLAVAGWLALCAAAVALLANLAACLRDAARPLPLAARVVGVAQPFLLAGVAIATVAAVADGPVHALAGSTRASVGILLAAGWVGLTVLGSLLHLLAVVVRVRGGLGVALPAPSPRRDAALAALPAVAIAASALAAGAGLDGWRTPATALLLISYALLGARVATLAGQVLVRVRPSF